MTIEIWQLSAAMLGAWLFGFKAGAWAQLKHIEHAQAEAESGGDNGG